MASARHLRSVLALAFLALPTVACAAGGDDDPSAASEDAISRGTPTWLTLAPRQCGSNPWNKGGGPLTGNGVEERAVITYFGTKGIALTSVGFVAPPQPVIVCAACQCPRGDLLVVEAATKADAKKLASSHGFADSKSLLMTASARQCGSNPWQQGASGGGTEDQKLASWATGIAAVTHAGFVEPTVPTATCAACQCPRGDTAILLAASDADAKRLVKVGFTAVK